MSKKIEFRFSKKRVVKILIKDYQSSRMADFIETELLCKINNVTPEYISLILAKDLNQEVFSDKVTAFYESKK